MRVLIVGGAGFLGLRLAAAFAHGGAHEVVLAERVVPAAPPSGAPPARWMAMDWRDDDAVRRAAAELGTADAIVHLAFPDWRSLSTADAAAETDAVRAGMSSLLDLSDALGAALLVHMSTAKVYGKRPPAAVDEDTPPNPDDLYAGLHRAAEQAMAERGAAGAVRVSFRLSNSFGCPVDPGTTRWDLIVNGMCRDAAAGGPIRLGSGSLTHRDFVPLRRVTDVLGQALAAPRSGLLPAKGWRAVNLGTGRSRSLRGMAELVSERARQTLGVSAPIEAAPPDPALTPLPVSYGSRYLPPLAPEAFEEMATAEIDATLRLCRERRG
jgi:UDP-glucose 4-epimerase